MNIDCFPKVIRIGAALSLIVALLAFFVRAAEAQVPSTQPGGVTRLSLGDAAHGGGADGGCAER